MSQYLGPFQEQGFDTWDSVLDITEADMYVEISLNLIVASPFSGNRLLTVDMECREALGVKLGHRRVSCRRPSSKQKHCLQ